MFKAIRILLFGILALALLVAGCIGAQAWWRATHHRYDRPNTGYYYGHVRALFYGMDDAVYSFHFRGQTEPRWRWSYPTNFAYRSLDFEWHAFGRVSHGATGTISLPSLAYQSSRGTGVLKRAVLAKWLLDSTDRGSSTNGAMRSVDAVFGFIEAAGRGSLPHPQHHSYHFEEPVRGYVQHVSLGKGVGGLVYVWVGIWLLSVGFVGRRLWRRYGRA